MRKYWRGSREYWVLNWERVIILIVAGLFAATIVGLYIYWLIITVPS